MWFERNFAKKEEFRYDFSGFETPIFENLETIFQKSGSENLNSKSEIGLWKSFPNFEIERWKPLTLNLKIGVSKP